MLKPTRCHKKPQFEMHSDAACAHTYFVRTSLKSSQATSKVFTYLPVNFVRFPSSLSQFLHADSNYYLSFLPTSRQVRRIISIVLFYFCLLFVLSLLPIFSAFMPHFIYVILLQSLYTSCPCFVIPVLSLFIFCIEIVHIELIRSFKFEKEVKYK
jgi:hypothetical protein